MKVLNHALCPQCRGTNTARGGYVLAQGGSMWKCRDCGHEFMLKVLVFVPQST